jgi:hypothetical protein
MIDADQQALLLAPNVDDLSVDAQKATPTRPQLL